MRNIDSGSLSPDKKLLFPGARSARPEQKKQETPIAPKGGATTRRTEKKTLSEISEHISAVGRSKEESLEGTADKKRRTKREREEEREKKKNSAIEKSMQLIASAEKMELSGVVARANMSLDSLEASEHHRMIVDEGRASLPSVRKEGG